MGNKCLSPCPTPLTDVKSKFRCSYFCCLKGATINVIHSGITGLGSETDSIDGMEIKDISPVEQKHLKLTEDLSKNGVWWYFYIIKTTI